MAKKTSTKSLKRTRRKYGIRKRLSGTAQRPRLSVFRSTKHIYAQLIDDDSGITLVSASTLGGEGYGGNKSSAKAVGQLVAQKAKEAGITEVVFDRNGFLYHGRIKVLADAAREGGLKF